MLHPLEVESRTSKMYVRLDVLGPDTIDVTVAVSPAWNSFLLNWRTWVMPTVVLTENVSRFSQFHTRFGSEAFARTSYVPTTAFASSLNTYWSFPCWSVMRPDAPYWVSSTGPPVSCHTATLRR